MKNYKTHILVWAIYYSYTSVSDLILGDYGNFVEYTVYFLSHNVFIFYTVVFCLQKASFRNIHQTLQTTLLFIAGFLAFACLRIFHRLVFIKMSEANYTPIKNYIEFNTNTVLWYIHVFLYALGYNYVKKFTNKERELRKSAEINEKNIKEKFLLQKRNLDLENEALSLKKDNLNKEQQQIQTEYAFLRSQINPHFLHNTLNFFYSKSLTGNTQELSEAILVLSEIMRYSLQKEETGAKEVLLSEEIEHIRNVIKINQLRFNNSLNIVFNTDGNIENLRVIPLILITLVENAFKHGDLNDAHAPLTIELNVCEKTVLQFTVANKKRKGPKELSHGIGINNIRRRLDIAYPQHYRLNKEENDTMYTISLEINNSHLQPYILHDTVLHAY